MKTKSLEKSLAQAVPMYEVWTLLKDDIWGVHLMLGAYPSEAKARKKIEHIHRMADTEVLALQPVVVRVERVVAILP